MRYVQYTGVLEPTRSEKMSLYLLKYSLDAKKSKTKALGPFLVNKFHSDLRIRLEIKMLENRKVS